VPDRKPILQTLRSHLLLRNQHACCICKKSGVQIHHIDSNPANNDPNNLAVLCLHHHSEVTFPSGLTARITSKEVHQYKQRWEKACLERVNKGVRARTAFFMVDYKNAERIRQLFSQLSPSEFETAYRMLCSELKEESELRRAQRFDISLEPTLMWSTPVERLLEFVRSGEAHPPIFQGAEGHPEDPFYPVGPAFSDPPFKVYYDMWCQLMVRAIVAVRSAYILDDLMVLDDPLSARLAGTLIAFEGKLQGVVASPGEWRDHALSETRLSLSDRTTTISTVLRLKTHYVYSQTASFSLAQGRGYGLLLFRDFDSVTESRGRRTMSFTSTPLMIGCGGGELLQIP